MPEPYGPGLRTLRGLIEQTTEAFLGAKLPCIGWFCEMMEVIRDDWINAHSSSRVRTQVHESWINIARASDLTSYTNAHNHVGHSPKAALTGVYYASSGHADGSAESTELRLLRPTMLNNAARRHKDSFTIPTTPGTLVLFPIYVKHSGDVHREAGDRISVAFNLRIDLL
jgi:hypothetical protein